MNNYLSEREVEGIRNSELGYASTNKFISITDEIKNGILVDVGVYQGKSSLLMINKSNQDNNKVYGIDPMPYFNCSHPKYTYIKDDSVKIGKEWANGPVDLVFFDSVHAEEQVLCELFYWWELIKEGGYGIFHDTSWEGYVHKPGHHAAGKMPGNSRKGYDSYGGIDWGTPDKAVNRFFNVNLSPDFRDINNDSIQFIYEDEYIKVETNFDSLGMTFIKKKKNFDYKPNVEDWDGIFKKREILLSFFK